MAYGVVARVQSSVRDDQLGSIGINWDGINWDGINWDGINWD
eukprot:SAG31_NODE_39091_length_291_cov_0.734375_1_plen_41_part_10